MFDFLNKIFDWLLQFLPQFRMVLPTEEGIRITAIPFIHSWYRVKKFGWYCYWPFLQEFHQIVVKPQIITVEVTREGSAGAPIESTWALNYRIQRVDLALLEYEDHEEMMCSQAAKVIGEFISRDCQNNTQQILEEIRKNIRGMGVYLQEVFPIQLTKVSAHKLFLDNVAEKLGRVVG